MFYDKILLHRHHHRRYLICPPPPPPPPLDKVAANSQTTFYMHFLENVWIYIKILLKFVSMSLTDNKPALVQVISWRPSLTHICGTRGRRVNTFRPIQNGRHFLDDIFSAFPWMMIYEFRLRFHWRLFLKVQLTIYLVGAKPLSEPMMVRLLTHIVVFWPQWVNCTIIRN